MTSRKPRTTGEKMPKFILPSYLINTDYSASIVSAQLSNSVQGNALFFIERKILNDGNYALWIKRIDEKIGLHQSPSDKEGPRILITSISLEEITRAEQKKSAKIPKGFVSSIDAYGPTLGGTGKVSVEQYRRIY